MTPTERARQAVVCIKCGDNAVDDWGYCTAPAVSGGTIQCGCECKFEEAVPATTGGELKPCPWCPVPPEVYRGAGYNYHVGCVNDTCIVGPYTHGSRGRERAVADWNARVSGSPVLADKQESHKSCREEIESKVRLIQALVNATGHESFGAALRWIQSRQDSVRDAVPGKDAVGIEKDNLVAECLGCSAAHAGHRIYSHLHTCGESRKNVEPEGEDSDGAYNAGEILALHKELIGPVEHERLSKTPWAKSLVYELVQRIANLRRMVAAPSPSEVAQERDALSEAIATAAKKAGIYNGEVPLTGPQLIMLCDDLALRPFPPDAWQLGERTQMLEALASAQQNRNALWRDLNEVVNTIFSGRLTSIGSLKNVYTAQVYVKDVVRWHETLARTPEPLLTPPSPPETQTALGGNKEGETMSSNDIKMAQVRAGEQAVIERLRAKGLLPEEEDSVNEEQNSSGERPGSSGETHAVDRPKPAFDHAFEPNRQCSGLTCDICDNNREWHDKRDESLRRRRATMPDYDKRLEDWLS